MKVQAVALTLGKLRAGATECSLTPRAEKWLVAVSLAREGNALRRLLNALFFGAQMCSSTGNPFRGVPLSIFSVSVSIHVNGVMAMVTRRIRRVGDLQ